MDKRYIIFGRESCPFCVMAADFCIASHLEHVFLNYENNKGILEDYKQFYQQDTVPIILENNKETGLVKKVGGYSDLISLFEEKMEKNVRKNKNTKNKRGAARKK